MNVKDYRQQVEAQLRSVRTQFESASQPNWTDALNQLSDPHADIGARRAALRTLQAGTFLGSQFAPVRPQYIAALRQAATDPDAGLRHAALDALVNLKDEFARQKLVEGLRDGEKALLAPAAALGLLARDDHGSASSLAREILASAADIATRAQAVRVLANDPSAKPLLSQIMSDKSEFSDVRRASAVALRALDSSTFATTARNILSDHRDFPEIKATVQGALERAGEPVDAAPKRGFLGNLWDRIRGLATGTGTGTGIGTGTPQS